VKLVYGDTSDEGAREVAQLYPDVPVLQDPGKKLATALGIDSYAVILYRESGRILEHGEGKVLYARTGIQQVLDAKAGLPPRPPAPSLAPDEPALPHQNLAPGP